MNPRTALIVAVLALVVGAAGVYFGIEAKNNSDDAQDSAEAVKTQLESQLGTTESEAAEHGKGGGRNHQERGGRGRQAERIGGQAPDVRSRL